MGCKAVGLADMGPGARGSAMDGSSAPRQNSDSGLRWVCERYMDIVNSCRAIVKPDVRGLLARTGSRRGGAPWLVAISLPARHKDTS